MLQRLIAAVLGVLGLAAIALGIASATAWRADDTLTATGTAADGTTLVTTAPGVLELGDPPVTVRAEAPPGTTVVLAVGRDTDVTGWVGPDAHTVVTGLSDWHTLATDAVEATAPGTAPAEGAPAPPVADPAGSDLWVAEATGDGSAEMVWEPRPGRWALLAAGVGEDPGPVTLELSWPRTVTTPWLLPGVVGGAVLLLLAILLALRARRRDRSARARHTMGTGAGHVAGPVGAGRPTDAAPVAREDEPPGGHAGTQANPGAQRTHDTGSTDATDGRDVP